MDTKRAYMDSHPWINFNFDLTRLSYRVWHYLGQIQSKCDHISEIPLLPEIAAEMHMIYLAKGARATVAIEGNTLTEDEVHQLVSDKGTLDLPPSMEYLETEAKNVINACNMIKERILSNCPTALTVEEIQQYHAIILNELPTTPQPGQFRTFPAGVGRYFGVGSEDIPYLTNRLCEWLSHDFVAPEELRVPVGILKAILAHLYIEWIHPFGDGNGRTGRMVEFRFLLSVGLPTDAAHLLTNHYNQTRSQYYRHLDMSSKLPDDEGVYLFIEYALQGFVDQLKIQIKHVVDQQFLMSWQSFVHEKFGINPTDRERRLRQFVMDLSLQEKPVPLNRLRHISPIVAETYATLATKTFRRDIRDLYGMELIAFVDGGFVANLDIMRGFMADRRNADRVPEQLLEEG